MTRRMFSPEEANRSLPLVRRIVADIVSKNREIQRVHEEYRQRTSRVPERASVSRHEREDMEHRVQGLVDELHEFVVELKSVGCELKDAEKGLIDFPGKIDEREVYLCWMLGEDDVGFWHEMDAGFAGRQALPKITRHAEAPPPGGEPALDKHRP